MRLPPLPVLSIALVFALAGCSGDGEPPPEATVPPGVIGTATPYAVEPQPTIVSGQISPRAGSGSAGEIVHVVEPGDTILAIAARYGTDGEAIMERNGISDPTSILVGQELVIPAATGASPPAGGGPRTSPENPPAASTHVVEDGDTAWAIASRFGVSIEQLAEANDMTVEELVELSIGDVLDIPPAD